MRPLLLVLALLAACSSGKRRPQRPLDADLQGALGRLDQEGKKGVGPGPTSLSPERRFMDRTREYGLEGVEGVSFAAVDLNRDGHSDLVVLPGYFHRPRYFLYHPTARHFRESHHRFFPESVQASFASFADFNRDGVPDAVVGVLNQRGEFTKVPLTLWHGSWDAQGLLRFTPAPGFPKLPPEPTSTVVVVDTNLDGRLDLFVGNWFQERQGAPIPGADRLLVNLPDGWVERSDWLNGERDKTDNDLFPPGARPTYGASSCDIDQDGWPDLLTAVSGGQGNKLWMNRPPRPGPRVEGRRFLDMGKETQYAADANGNLVPTGGGRTFSAVCADYNNDGIMDVFLGELTHSWDNHSVDRSSVLSGSRLGPSPFFLRTEYMADDAGENWNQGDKRANWADMDLDGLLDLVVDNSGFPPRSRLVVFRQDETHAFNDESAAWGTDLVNPTGTLVWDVNGDGKPDLLTGQSNVRQADLKNRLWLLENVGKASGRALVFHLRGKTANLQGLGAMVMLHTKTPTGRVIQRRWNELSQGGLPSQAPEGVAFGVEHETRVTGLKVRWPVLRGARPLETTYTIGEDPSRPRQDWTLCEDGRALPGQASCR